LLPFSSFTCAFRLAGTDLRIGQAAPSEQVARMSAAKSGTSDRALRSIPDFTSFIRATLAFAFASLISVANAQQADSTSSKQPAWSEAQCGTGGEVHPRNSLRSLQARLADRAFNASMALASRPRSTHEG
jgi:hypothetical protein